MTELEQQLMSGLKSLSSQYAADMKRLEKQNFALSQQVSMLAQQVEVSQAFMKTLAVQLKAL